MGTEVNACSDSSACPDQTTLLQSKVQMHMFDDDDPSLMEHEHRTSIEVNMATTKVLGGVPIYNYHLANAGGMNPSLAELSEQKAWIIIFDDTTTDDDEAKFCADLKNLGTNVQCVDSGDPDNNGEPYVVVRANEAELKSVLSQHFSHVRYGEPDGPTGIDDPEPDPSLIEEEATSLPWGLDRIDDPTGQDGSYKTPANSKQGAGAHVYVADTGIWTKHVDFEGRAIPAYDYYKKGNDKVCPQGDANCGRDKNGHGTHCAGTIGGKKYGVAKKTSLYAAKVLSDGGSGSFAGILGSLDYVMSKGKKPAIWSASLGGRGTMHSVADTFKKANKANILISVAAGNSNADACGFTPAFAPAAITVGATQKGDRRAGYSNYGKCIDIFAPGSQVLSAWWNSDTASKTISGTSMACPHVSGVAALLYGDFPGSDAASVEGNIKTFAEKQRVTDAKTGSPNLMLHVPSWVPGGPIQTFTTTTTTTTTTTAKPGLLACSFESSSKPYCGLWQDARGDKFDWSRKSGRTPSSNTGPDKASDGSYYLFIEASYPRKNKDNAILETNKKLQIGSAASLSFDYHMKGGHINTLKVLANSDVVFEKTQAQGSSWKSANIALAQYTGKSVKFVIEANRGSSWQGDIAIDNVNLFVGTPGGGGPPAATTGAPPATTQWTPPATTGAPGTTGAPPATTQWTPPATTGAPPVSSPPATPPSGDLGKKVDALQKTADEILKLLKSLQGR